MTHCTHDKYDIDDDPCPLCELEALRAAARRTVDALRGSGGIDPEGAAALRVLESLLNRVTFTRE